MITISHVLDELIKASPFLEDFMSKGLINYSSLARELRPQVEKKLQKPVKDSAVMMALKRRPVSRNQIYSMRVSAVLQQISDISIRSSLVGYTFKHSLKLKACTAKLLQEIGSDTESFTTVSQGIYETTIIINNRWEQLLLRLYEEEEIINTEPDLTCINIRLPEHNIKVKGIYYMIFKVFVDADLNIIDVVSTSNELTILIESKDSEKAFSTINYLKKIVHQ